MPLDTPTKVNISNKWRFYHPPPLPSSTTTIPLLLLLPSTQTPHLSHTLHKWIIHPMAHEGEEGTTGLGVYHHAGDLQHAYQPHGNQTHLKPYLQPSASSRTTCQIHAPSHVTSTLSTSSKITSSTHPPSTITYTVHLYNP